LLVTAIAAVFLLFAVWQAYRLNQQAGSDVRAIARERVGLQYQQMLLPFVLDVDRYRLETQSLHAPQFAPDLRTHIDREVTAITTFTVAHDSDLDALTAWRTVEKNWSRARTLKRGYTGPLFTTLIHGILVDVIYHVEDASGLQYESNRFAQDLADMGFWRIPSSLNDVMHGDLYAENAQVRGSIPIPDRIRLAALVSGMNPDGGDFDLLADDWDAIMAQAAKRGLAIPQDVTRYRADNAAFREGGRAFGHYVNSGVVMRERASGEAGNTRAMAHRTVGTIVKMDADVATLLDRLLVQRMNYEVARNRYVYAAALLAAVLLIGIMLLVAEFTARRDRELLLKAQQESARLGAELARQNAERALRLSEAQFRTVFEGAAVGIAILDRNGAVLDANMAFRNIYGENAAGFLAAQETEFQELMRGERDLFEFEQHVMTPSGQEAWTDSTVSLVLDETGQPYFAICMFRDLTDLKRNERRMLHDLTHDALTGLPNRGHFEQKVREQFVAAQTCPEASFAVLIVDLDRFKDVNESLGHDAGDFVISQVAQRIRGAVEGADLVARLAGDEFAVLLRSLPDVLHVEVIAKRILGALAKPIAIGQRSIFASASVGIALAGSMYCRGEDVMRDADIAVHYAKGGGGGRFAVFDSKMHARAQKRLQLTTDLRLALENGEFDQLYQPIVSIVDGSLVGCEALLRWNHPLEGVVVPGDFMPLAEQTGLAAPIGRFVIRTAFRQLARWKCGERRSAIPMNVNVSAAELLDPEFESMVVGAAREFGIDPADVTLEITESVVLDAGTRPTALLGRLRASGFKICIDDFGTGYSSLRYLQQFEVDSIKIDRSFVSGHDGEVASEPIVRTLMTLADAFDVRVVAEGIETQRQRDILRNAGCRFGQGYYYARALSADELTAMYPSVFAAMPRHASA
jgi:diguanylate cyclase (GGDEF)-like protein/PAS domain S-box-containing protein